MTERPGRLRIVHPGGHASMAQVWLGDQQLHCVTRIEIAPLDLDDRGPVTAMLTVVDPEIAIEADLAELVVREVPVPPVEDPAVTAAVTQNMTATVSNTPPTYWINS